MGLVAPSQATESAQAFIWISNQRPHIGDPERIRVIIQNCPTVPTSVTLSLAIGNQNGTFGPAYAQLTDHSTGFSIKKSGTEVSMQWLYRGPTGDGVDSNGTVVSIAGSGGCAADSRTFQYAENYWFPVQVNNQPPWQPSIAWSYPDLDGLQIFWENQYGNDSTSSLVYYEVQYAPEGSNNWSGSLVTKDTNLYIRGLAQGTIYDLRIRAGNKYGKSSWGTANGLNSQRTPASFKIWASALDNTQSHFFASSAKVKMHIHATGCTAQPALNTFNFYATSVIGGHPSGFGGASGTAESADDATAVFDESAGTYDLTWTMPTLADGTYAINSIFYGLSGCHWDFGPNPNNGVPVSNTVQIVVGNLSAELPFWGSLAAANGISMAWPDAVPSANSAVINWVRPTNISAGPFTYEVSLYDGSGQKLLAKYSNLTDTSVTVTGLQPDSFYSYTVTAQNSATTTPESRPSQQAEFFTPPFTAKTSTATNVAAFAKLTGIKIPAGAKVSLGVASDTFAFKDCTSRSNKITFGANVGACTVQLTVTPRKVGKKKPVTRKTSFDFLITK